MLRFLIVFIWMHGLILLCRLRCTRLMLCSIFLSLRCLWTLSLRASSWICNDFEWLLTDSVDPPRLLNFHLHSEMPDSAVFLEEEVETGCCCWLACEDERGKTRSRDLDLSALLVRFLCSADDSGPADGDKESSIVKSSSDISSSDPGVTIGWICGSCGTGTWGYTRSRDLDRCICLSPCGGGSSSSAPSLIGIWVSWGWGVKVADAGVIAHALYILSQLFLCHLLVMVLQASMAVYQADLAVLKADEVQEAPEVVDLVDQMELQDHQRK